MATIIQNQVGFVIVITGDDRVQVKLGRGLTVIENSILMILNTIRGERMNRPTYGSTLQLMVFEPGDGPTLNDIVRDVRESIQRWEKRITLETVDAKIDPQNDHKIIVRIRYTVEGQPQVIQELIFVLLLG